MNAAEALRDMGPALRYALFAHRSEEALGAYERDHGESDVDYWRDMLFIKGVLAPRPGKGWLPTLLGWEVITLMKASALAAPIDDPDPSPYLAEAIF